MQGVLACIDANGVSDCSGCLMGHSDVLLVLLSPRSFSERFGAGARPVHPILRHQLNDEQTDKGPNFLKSRGRSVKPAKEKRLAQWHHVLAGCALASMRYDNEIRVFSRLVAKSVVGNNQ